MDIYLTKVDRQVVQKNNVELASRLSHGIFKINMAILVDYQSTTMLNKYIYIYIDRCEKIYEIWRSFIVEKKVLQI